MPSINIAANMPTLQALVHFDYSDLTPIAELQAKFVFDGDAVVLAQLPTPVAAFDIVQGNGITIAATIPPLVAEFITAEGIVAAAALPRLMAAMTLVHDIGITMSGKITLYASMEMFQESNVALEASIPGLKAAIEIVQASIIDVSGTLPTLTAEFEGTIDNDLIITATLPPLVAALFIDLADDCTYELRYER